MHLTTRRKKTFIKLKYGVKHTRPLTCFVLYIYILTISNLFGTINNVLGLKQQDQKGGVLFTVLDAGALLCNRHLPHFLISSHPLLQCPSYFLHFRIPIFFYLFFDEKHVKILNFEICKNEHFEEAKCKHRFTG